MAMKRAICGSSLGRAASSTTQALAINTQRYEKKGKTFSLRRVVRPAARLEEGTPVLVRRTSASMAASVEKSRTGVLPLLSKASRFSA
jgi:hypothetical protein